MSRIDARWCLSALSTQAYSCLHERVPAVQLAERETTELRDALEGLDRRHKNLNQELERTGQVWRILPLPALTLELQAS